MAGYAGSRVEVLRVASVDTAQHDGRSTKSASPPWNLSSAKSKGRAIFADHQAVGQIDGDGGEGAAPCAAGGGQPDAGGESDAAAERGAVAEGDAVCADAGDPDEGGRG